VLSRLVKHASLGPMTRLLLAICETRAVPGRDLPLCSRGCVEAPFVALLPDGSQGADNRGLPSMSSGDEAERLAQAAWMVE
jgi:hypothetical protein